MVACVLASSVAAWAGSSSETAPAWKRAFAIPSPSSWMRALSSAIRISTSAVRSAT